MPQFGPPTIFPPVPINEPGNGPQGPITFVPGVYQDFFQPEQQVVVLDASRRGVPLQTPTTTVPPDVFQQED